MPATGATQSPCGACKFLRRKCPFGCVFVPYFSSEQGPAQFAAIHKVFGASNVSKLLQQLPIEDRYEAAVTIGFEAQARLREPVYGCVAHIFALQQQVSYLQAQLRQVKAQMATNQIMTNHQVNGNFNSICRSSSNHLNSHDEVHSHVSAGTNNLQLPRAATSKEGSIPVSSHESSLGTIDQAGCSETTVNINRCSEDGYYYISEASNNSHVHHLHNHNLVQTGYWDDNHSSFFQQVQTTSGRKRPGDDEDGELHELALRMIKRN